MFAVVAFVLLVILAVAGGEGGAGKATACVRALPKEPMLLSLDRGGLHLA